MLPEVTNQVKTGIIFLQTSMQSDFFLQLEESPLLAVRFNTGLSHFHFSFIFKTRSYIHFVYSKV